MELEVASGGGRIAELAVVLGGGRTVGVAAVVLYSSATSRRTIPFFKQTDSCSEKMIGVMCKMMVSEIADWRV